MAADVGVRVCWYAATRCGVSISLTGGRVCCAQAELQTASQRVTLSDSSPTPVPVAPGESHDSVISHEVKELGKHTCVTPPPYCFCNDAVPMLAEQRLHTCVWCKHDFFMVHRLICTVTYTNQDGDKLFFRKSFKFMISNPLAVKTKVYNVEVCILRYTENFI